MANKKANQHIISAASEWPLRESQQLQDDSIEQATTDKGRRAYQGTAFFGLLVDTYNLWGVPIRIISGEVTWENLVNAGWAKRTDPTGG